MGEAYAETQGPGDTGYCKHDPWWFIPCRQPFSLFVRRVYLKEKGTFHKSNLNAPLELLVVYTNIMGCPRMCAWRRHLQLLISRNIQGLFGKVRFGYMHVIHITPR